MAKEAADVLIKKGKRATAAYIQGVCNSPNNHDVMNEVFGIILNPEVLINNWDAIDWCRWLFAGGRTPEEYTQIVKNYDNASTCGLVWTSNFVAYRCRTCGISPCMSLCSECFQKGDHTGHDFNMFRSQAGGACDCGDKSVMKETGFCRRHGLQNQTNKPEVPPDLLCVAEVLMPRLFLRLVQHLRDNDEIDATTINLADSFLTFLQSQSEMGAAMRSVMSRALNNPQVYQNLAGEKEELGAVRELRHCCFLDELVYWTIKLEFPQKLVCLLLFMMPDLSYKEAFTKLFVRHYSQISHMLAKSNDSDTLSNRVVHVSVQLFSNEDLAYQMTRDYNLLQTMIDSLNSMMLTISKKSILQCAETNEHLVVNCSDHIMKEHCYWPLVSDLNNVLTHSAVANEFLSNEKLLSQWFRFLSLFQGMNVNQRQLLTHVEFESNTYYAAFSAELEASATPMWALISHLKKPESSDKTKVVLSICLQTLQDWFASIGLSAGDEINAYQVSFHLPLHRCFASFLGQAVRQQGVDLDPLLPSDDVLKLMMMHPLQAQVSFHEILCNMWVRSGLQIKGQAMTYIQCHFCNSSIDPDIFLLQLCAMKLDPDWFVKTIMQRFHVWEWFSLNPEQNNSFLDYDKVMPMLEGALCFLAALLSTHTNIGQTEEEVTRQEMVSLLCMSDRTHSQLMDLLPDKCGETFQNKNFESILNEVADYKAPNFEATGAMMQGTYVPKAKIWEEEYNPIHVLLRSVHRREFQSALDRYSQYLRQFNKSSGSSTCWPPFRIPPPVMEKFKDPRRILHCKTMHGIIFTILYRALNDPELPEQILGFCVYLLDMAVRFPSPNPSPSKCQQSEPKEVDDLKYKEWFDSSDTLQNTTKVIDSVAITEKVVMSMRMVEEMEIDEESEEDVEMGLESYAVYDVHSPIVEEDFQAPIQSLSLPTTTQLALPSASTSSSTSSTVVPFSAAPNAEPSTSTPSTSAPPVSKESALQRFASAINMALIPTSEGLTTVRPKCMKLKQVPGRHRMLLSDKGLPLASGVPESSDIFSGEQRYRSFSNKKTRSINESMLSILIQLHAKLTGRSDSYKPKETKPSDSECGRIGDGAVFVERLLDYVAFTGEEKMASIQSTRQKLWPPIKAMNETVSTSNSARSVDREERRQRAKERQQKLMAEFASKQKAFLQKTMETDCREEASAFDEPAPEVKKEYECVICSQMSPSEEERPVGMVVLLQATSVAGHYHENSVRTLPCDDEDRNELQKGKNVAAMLKNKIETLVRLFDGRHWPMALNIGWEGGVYVQTCGHYLHVDCHKAYIQSLKNQSQLSSRLQNLSVDSGEYYCPLCRQLANSVIPLSPDFKEPSAVVQFPVKQLKVLAAEIAELLSTPLSERDSNLLKKYMGGVMEDMTNATYPQYRSVCSPNPSNLFLFVCSIARTNLEIELIQRGPLLNALRKKSCFVPLLNVLSLHSNLLSQTIDKNERMDYALKVWSRLTGHFSLNRYALALLADDVPLLFRDPIAILLQIILALPMNVDKDYFRCVVQVLFNFLFIQSLVQLSCHLKSYQRNELKLEAIQTMKDGKSLKEVDKKNIRVLLGYVVRTFECSPLYVEDDEMSFSENVIDETDVKTLDRHLQKHCLQFLKIAALIQSHLYEDSIHIKAEDDVFQTLCQYLGLVTESGAELTISSCVNWITSDSRLTINTWCEDLLFFVNSSVVAARELLQKNIVSPPSLLDLPHNYDEVFKYYHKKSCTVCHTVPKDPSLCLVCGVMVCLRENCCRKAQNEAVSHSVSCGAGTAIYLAVNSSTIIVIRGKRACLWGSVYLDSFGEEDRDLKRGKPLFLSKERYSLLKQQWLNHSFDHTSKRWVWHKDNL